jgi:hypothetical protein
MVMEGRPVLRGRDGADPPGKGLGLAVFAVGIVLLVFVFYRGYVELIQAGLLQQTMAQAQNPGRLDALVVFSVLAKWLVLFLLAYVASSICGRGISLYQAARGLNVEEG